MFLFFFFVAAPSATKTDAGTDEFSKECFTSGFAREPPSRGLTRFCCGKQQPEGLRPEGGDTANPLGPSPPSEQSLEMKRETAVLHFKTPIELDFI